MKYLLQFIIIAVILVNFFKFLKRVFHSFISQMDNSMENRHQKKDEIIVDAEFEDIDE